MKNPFSKIPQAASFISREDKLTHDILRLAGAGTYSIPEVVAAGASVVIHAIKQIPSAEAQKSLTTNIINGLREHLLGEKIVAQGGAADFAVPPSTIIKPS